MHIQSLCILGRQPAIGRAELESLFGGDHLQQVQQGIIGCDLPVSDITFSRLGSTVKLATKLDTLPRTNISRIHEQLIPLVSECASTIADGKIQLGVSVYGIKTSPKQLMAIGLNLKKALKNAGHSVRLIPNQEVELSSAQVLHNHLTGERGIELLLIAQGDTIIVGRTAAVQDITAYAERDQERPKRDAFVGMLPPKLAQTIINLATDGLKPMPEYAVLDPFCGTGVLLQEALLMGYSAYGTDLEPRMVDYSEQNLAWLAQHYDFDGSSSLEIGDATDFTWTHPFSTVACETYLGHPLANWPRPEKLQQIIGTCNLIVEKFVRNLSAQIPSGTRLCLAVPAWINPNGRVHHLPMLDDLEKMGYNRVSFMHSREEDMIYHRSDQIVARELLVITRK